MSKYSTRLLLSVTAVAVVCGIIIAATGPLHSVIIVGFPPLYGLLIGLYFLPAAITQPLYRVPGIAILTAAAAGLITTISPLNNRGFMAFVYVISVGLLQELPYFMARYRSWNISLGLMGGAVAGGILAVAFYFLFGISTFPLWAQITQIVVSVASPLIFIVIGDMIAKALNRAGIGEKA